MRYGPIRRDNEEHIVLQDCHGSVAANVKPGLLLDILDEGGRFGDRA